MKGLLKRFDNGSAHVPGTMLSSLHPSSHCCQQSCEISTVITLFLMMKELRLKEIKSFDQNLTGSEWWNPVLNQT